MCDSTYLIDTVAMSRGGARGGKCGDAGGFCRRTFCGLRGVSGLDTYLRMYAGGHWRLGRLEVLKAWLAGARHISQNTLKGMERQGNTGDSGVPFRLIDFSREHVIFSDKSPILQLRERK